MRYRGYGPHRPNGKEWRRKKNIVLLISISLFGVAVYFQSLWGIIPGYITVVLLWSTFGGFVNDISWVKQEEFRKAHPISNDYSYDDFFNPARTNPYYRNPYYEKIKKVRELNKKS